MMPNLRRVSSRDGVTIACFESGSGPPLVMLHGGANDHTFAPELTGILTGHFTVIKPDRRGRGDSGDHRDYTLAKEVDDLVAVLESCDHPPVLFASSFGALIAVEALARDLPDIKRVVLFEPPIQRQREEPVARKAHTLNNLVAAGRHDEAVAFHQSAFHMRSDEEISAARADRKAWTRRLALVETNAREMLALHDGYTFEPDRLRDPRCPVILLMGDRTIPFLTASARHLSAVHFIATQVLVGVDHSGPVTHPQLIADVILQKQSV